MLKRTPSQTRKARNNRKAKSIKPRRLGAESLEDRKMMTYCTVSNIAPTADPGTIQYCFDKASADTYDDKIVFHPSLDGQTLDVSGLGLFVLEGSGDMFIDGGDRDITLDAGNTNEHFVVFETSTAGQRSSLRVENLTLTGGTPSASVASSIYAADAELKMSNVTIEGNSGGRAVYVHTDNADPDAHVDIRHSAFRDNVGGGLFVGNTGFLTSSGVSNGEINIVSSEFSGNSVNGEGAGIDINNHTHAGQHYLDITIDNTTVSGNTSNRDGAGVNISGDFSSTRVLNSTVVENDIVSGAAPAAGRRGAGIYVSSGNGVSTISMDNTIVFDNSSSASGVEEDVHLHPAIVGSGTNNLIKDTPPTGYGISSSTADPMLAPLADNGGLTRTHAILPLSAAKDTGDNGTWLAAYPTSSVRTVGDQRGPMFTRIAGGAVGGDVIDIGAYECNNAIRGRTIKASSRFNKGYGVSNVLVTATQTGTLSTTHTTHSTSTPLESVMDVDINADGIIDASLERGWYWFDDLDAGSATVQMTPPSHYGVFYPHATTYDVATSKGGGTVDFGLTQTSIIALSSDAVAVAAVQISEGLGSPFQDFVSNVITFDQFGSNFRGDEYAQSHGVSFDFGDVQPGLFGVYPEGDPNSVEQLDGYDGEYRDDGNPVLIKWPNHETPLTINFDEPVSTVGSFIGTGIQGEETSLTIEAFDSEGRLLLTTPTHVDTHQDQENREGFWGIRSDSANIASVKVRNNNSTDFGNALIMDDVVYARPRDYDAAWGQAHDAFVAAFDGAGEVHQPSIEAATSEGDRVVRFADDSLIVRMPTTQEVQSSIGIDIEGGTYIETLDGYDGRLEDASSPIIVAEVGENVNAVSVGPILDASSPAAMMGLYVGLAAHNGDTGLNGARVRATSFDEFGDVHATASFDIDSYANQASAEAFIKIGGIEGKVDRVQLDVVDGMTGRIVEQPYTMSISQIRLVGGQGPTCDLTGDGVCDGRDADLLVENIAAGTGDPGFDLNGDGMVDRSDLDQWLSDAGSENLGAGAVYLPGDANLDGIVDISDFNLWNAHKFTSTPAWTKADFNADGSVDISDFNLWNAHKFQSSDSLAAPARTVAGEEVDESADSQRESRLATLDQIFASESDLGELSI